MKFTYKAKSKVDEITEGVIDAPNKDEALNALWEKGLFPIEVTSDSVTPEGGETQGTGQSRETTGARAKINLPFLRKKIKTQHLLVFTQQLATMIRAKVELLTALKIVHDHTDHPAFKDVIFKIYSAVREGKEFSDSLENFPKIFSPLYVNIIKAGETGGTLDTALGQISEFVRREEGLKSKVMAALAYPAILLFVGAGSIFVLINFVVPRLKFMFEGLGSDLPLITRIVLRISEFSNNTWLVVGGLVLVFFLVVYFQKGSPFFREWIRKVKAVTPVIGRITKNQELAYFARSLGMLLKSGVPALKCLATTIPGIQDPKFRKELEAALKKVSAGTSLFDSLDSVTCIPGFFTRMVAVGEQSGRLTDIFAELSRSYTEQVEADIAVLSSLLEPLLILFLGLIMGAIVISILVPMFQITQMAG